jgi:hypothetical protein
VDETIDRPATWVERERRAPEEVAPRGDESGAEVHTDDRNPASSGVVSGTIAAQPLQVRAFLDQLFGGVATGEEGTLERGQLPIWSSKTKRTVWCSTLGAATTALVDGSNRGENVYHSVALHDPDVALAEARRKKGNPTLPLEATRGCAKSAVVLGGLWSDEDHAGGKHEKQNLPPDRDTVLAYLASLPAELTPSLILDSGGGFYPWWLYREPRILETDQDRADAADLVERLQRYIRDVHAPGYEHDSTWDLARVLRPPGVVNHKYGVLVRAITLDRSGRGRG